MQFAQAHNSHHDRRAIQPGEARMTTVSHHAGVHAQDPTDRASWWVLGFIGVAQFMVILDVTVVNIALPSIGTALSFSASDLQWVVTVYVLFTGGLMLLGGRSADLFGRRRVFLVGLLVFTAASSGQRPCVVAARADRLPGSAGLRCSAPAAVCSGDHHDDILRRSERSRLLSGVRSVVPASPLACCLAASSRQRLVGSGSSSSTSRSGLWSRPVRYGSCPPSSSLPSTGAERWICLAQSLSWPA